MPQVVTSENFAQFVETGSVPAFEPPKPAEPATAAEAKPESSGPARGPDGKFIATVEKETAVAPDPVDKTPEKGNITDAPKGEDDSEDDNGLTAKERQRYTEDITRKIGAKHRQLKEAEELAETILNQRDEAARRAESAEAKLREIEAKSRPAAEPAKEPDPKDFATVQDYREALREFVRSEELAKLAQEREEQAKQEQARQFGERLAKAKEKYADFDKAVRTLETVIIHNEVIAYIEESDFGPDLLYGLAKDPKEVERLKKLSPRKAIAELAKRELKLEQPPTTAAAPKEAPVRVSQAPAPIAPLEGKSSAVQKDPAKMTLPELREHRRAEEAAKRRR